MGEEEEVRFLPEHEARWKSNMDSLNVSSGYLADTSDGYDGTSDSNIQNPTGGKNIGKNNLSPSSANRKKYQQKNKTSYHSEVECHSSSDYHAKSSSDATILTAMTTNGEYICQPKKETGTQSETIRLRQNNKEEEIIVISDETKI